ncbi:hypothetical protein CBS101457_004974 [Exobasidium rhododendri]|nr:hypothetical protein CBS101457_004974 [Exobasidium rhododendri]
MSCLVFSVDALSGDVTLEKRSDRRSRRASRGRASCPADDAGGEDDGGSSSSNARSFARSESFKTIAQLTQGVVGGYIANQALNYDMQNRSGPGFADLDGSNPFNAPGAIHVMAGAAVASAVTDPTAVVSAAKKCFGAACRSLSFNRLRIGEDSSAGQEDEGDATGDADSEESRSGRLSRKASQKAIKYESREERMSKTRRKKSMVKQKSNVGRQ